MSTTAGRVAAVLAAAGLLATGTVSAADAQERSQLPVAAPGPVHDGARGHGLRPPGDRRRVGLLPLDPDARGLVHRPRSPKSRSLRDLHRLHALSTVFVPVVGHGLRTAAARPPADGTTRSPHGSRPGDDASRDDGTGRESPERASSADDAGRSEPEGPCFEVRVRVADGATHRIRGDGASLEADTPAEGERHLRDRMARQGALVVEGLDGASLHLDVDRVHDVSVEHCPAIVVP